MSARTHSSQWLLVLLVSLSGCGAGPYPAPSPTGPSAPPAPLSVGFTLSGVVSEPAGDPIAGVNVQLSGKTAITDEGGRYVISELSGSIGLELSKEGYEPLIISGYQMSSDRVLNLLLTPTIRIAAGESKMVTFYDADRGYSFPSAYSECGAPCKLIRVTMPAAGSLAVKLTAGDPARRLSVFTNDGNLEYCCTAQLTIPFAFSGPGEQIFYVTLMGGAPIGTARRIDIATSFQPR
jgi:carboxypeptidase family protein